MEKLEIVCKILDKLHFARGTDIEFYWDLLDVIYIPVGLTNNFEGIEEHILKHSVKDIQCMLTTILAQEHLKEQMVLRGYSGRIGSTNRDGGAE